MLALAGGVLGLVLAWGGLRALVALKGGNLPRRGRDRHRRDGDGLHAARLAADRACSSASRPRSTSPASTFTAVSRKAARGATSDRGSHAVRRALVVAELALALTLLTGAGLLSRASRGSRTSIPASIPSNLLTFNLSLPRTPVSVGHGADRLLRRRAAADRRRSPASRRWARRRCFRSGGPGPPRASRSRATRPRRASRVRGATCAS